MTAMDNGPDTIQASTGVSRRDIVGAPLVGGVALLAGSAMTAQAAESAELATAGSPELKALIDDLVAANRILYHQGVLDGFGHVSVRDPRNPDHFLMAKAMAPGRVTAGDIMEYDREGAPIDARGRSVYAERFIHSEVYKVRKDVNAVIHSHSPTVIPFTVTQVPLQPVAQTSAFLSGGVPVFEIRETAGMTSILVDDSTKGAGLAQKLTNRPVALMRGHGNLVVAQDLRLAVYRAIYTEMNARMQIQAMALGGPITFIAPEEAAKIEGVRAKVAQGGGQGQDRTWEMWKSEAVGKVD